jgi:uncharacterized surface protein with fasciclin (FAS1) repeats
VALVVVVAVIRSTGGGGSDSGSGERSDPAASASGSPGAPGSAIAPALRGLVGSGCGDYDASVPSGPGSIAAMTAESVTAAIAANPLLKTLDEGLSGRLNAKVSLTGLLAGGQFTVFAPIDSGFAKMPAAALQRLTLEPASLRKTLSHLVVRGQLSPSQVVGAHPTLAGDSITVTSAADTLRVGAATVVCGGLGTANATIYLVDAVPLPPR